MAFGTRWVKTKIPSYYSGLVCTQDWWNSTSFTNYYRTWNVVVHDWLFYYGYRDFLWVRTPTAVALVYLLSGGGPVSPR